MSKKLDMQFTYDDMRGCYTYWKCPKCGHKVVCDCGYMAKRELNEYKIEDEICEECGYEYEITHKITVEINAEYSEPETCKRCDTKEAHEHVS